MKYTELKKILDTAKTIATKAHEGQFRYDGKTPFITHPEFVASIFELTEAGILLDTGAIYPFAERGKKYMEAGIVSWLHDVIEDTDVNFGDLLNQGIPFYLVAIIEILTHRENEKYRDQRPYRFR